ncbi:DUF3060 domain-containing protein [Nocardiopsis valliformis]|uniref:DUF3060 domain-containing protein n=1 Tax=Nocardiopsis valliformis TaxID=239974 RepID=UPI000A03F8AD|nr:DUF3060 domain-containing protein [Nocardiopsis valliformis]
MLPGLQWPSLLRQCPPCPGGVRITGDRNTVNMVTVREIDDEGSDNTITYDDGSPEIDDEGTGNDISSQN